MLRITACLCIVIIGGVCGMAMSDKLKKRRDCCREVQALLTRISSLIRYREMNVYEIVSELRETSVTQKLKFIERLPISYETGEDFHDSWEKELRADENIPDEEKEVLISFGKTFGTSDTEGQLLSAEQASERIYDIEKQRSEEYLKKGKLFRSVGVLFGIMAGIMIV